MDKDNSQEKSVLRNEASIDATISKTKCPGSLVAKVGVGLLVLWGLEIGYHKISEAGRLYVLQETPEYIFVDSLYQQDMNAINFSNASFHTKREQRNTLKKDFDFKINSINEAYKSNYGQ